MLFLNTRPADRAAALTQGLQAHQIDVLELPLLELQAAPWTAALAEQVRQLPQADVIVAVSPSAVHYGMAAAQRAGVLLGHLQHTQWIAVGEATAQALQEYGISSHVPQIETSEGMLRLPLLQHLNCGAAVAFWRGLGGRQFMMDTLSAQGIQVMNLILYHRSCPAQAWDIFAHNIARLQQAAPRCLLVTSEAGWNNWLALTAQHIELLQDTACLTLGERLRDVLSHYRHQHALNYSIHVLNDLRLDSILKQIAAVQGHS